MNNREFENLKPGDRVFYVTNWWDGTEEYKAYELEVKGKKTEKDGQKIVLTYCESGNKNCRCGGHNLDADGVGLTKAEAWKAEIELVEERIKRKEAEIAEDRECLYRYKVELAKAKEEEESGWVIINEHIYKAFPSDRYRGFQKYPTEQEAHEALAEYHKGKYEEELVKSGKARFIIRCGDKVCLVQDVEDFDGENAWCRNYYGFWNLQRKDNVFNSRQEAEAELKKRKDAQALEAATRRQV